MLSNRQHLFHVSCCAVWAAIAVAAAHPASAGIGETVILTNVASVDALGDPDNDIRIINLTGGYQAGAVHIFGQWSNPNGVSNTRPSQCAVRASGPGGVVKTFLLTSVFSIVADGTLLTSATLEFDGIDPAGQWSFEFYEQLDNLAGVADSVWTNLTFEFETVAVTPNGADITICQLFDLKMKLSAALPPQREGSDVGLTMATTSWNIGDRNLMWLIQPDERHPYIAMNLYRIEQGRFEQIGYAWAKHGFNALSFNQCGGLCNRTNGKFLGVGCTDTYTANTNANQFGLGPRFEIDPWTGDFTYAGSILQQGIPGGDTNVSRRLLVSDADLDPAIHQTAEYRYECFYVARDDINAMNNAAWKPVSITGQDAQQVWQFAQTTSTTPPVPGFALEAWQGARLTTLAQELPVDEFTSPDGRCMLGSNVIDLGGGLWQYEYALLNVDMARQVGRFELSVPFGVQITNIGFSAPRHANEPYNVPLADGGVPIDNAPWVGSRSPESVTWITAANPLRWATAYSFWFTADRAPSSQGVALGLFRPGAVSQVQGLTDAPVAPPLCPGDASGDRAVNFNDISAVLSNWGESGPAGDANSDGVVNFTDITSVLSNWLAPCL